ncbi:hypothetical protein [Pseudonocardia sp. KRD291]|uniref:WXG100-like domain-containing protein n=1 Tax=Pseudonocardia sp. KRD291 TaxID=2792007 RepID=UPI001C49FFA2|nr:hypothetical protein [Pseudonocardia sp. KRD291]MBW0105537.1 hypothetical protein [Pseudonocardia sp. KRD291]
MTDPDPVPEQPGRAGLLDQAVAWRRVAEELDAAVTGTSALAAGVAEAWTDRAGQSWAQRLELVGRELDRQAGVAADLVRVVTALADGGGEPARPHGGDPAPPQPDITGPIAPVADAVRAGPGAGRVPHGPTTDDTGPYWSLPDPRLLGPRLGGTDGGRASERRGVVVPTLPDQPGG